jgi:hypothetical protein
MGGFTKIKLKDTSEDAIIAANCLLDLYKVSKKYRFYSRRATKEEYTHFLNNNGHYPEHMFPRNKIKSYEDFLKYWNPTVCGECFVPHFGTLTFDCYFSRTPAIQMKRIANFLLSNTSTIEKVGGSYETFVERCGKRSHLKKQLLNIQID